MFIASVLLGSVESRPLYMKPEFLYKRIVEIMEKFHLPQFRLPVLFSYLFYILKVAALILIILVFYPFGYFCCNDVIRC